MEIALAIKMKQLIFSFALFILLSTIVYSAGEFGAGTFGDGSFGFGTPEPEPTTSSGGGGDGGGGGGGRLLDGYNEPKFTNGSKTLFINYNDAFRFYFEDKQYYFVILNVYEDSINARITPIFKDLTIEQIHSLVDLNGDGIYDLTIT